MPSLIQCLDQSRHQCANRREVFAVAAVQALDPDVSVKFYRLVELVAVKSKTHPVNHATDHGTNCSRYRYNGFHLARPLLEFLERR
jgi:hypothetical protein